MISLSVFLSFWFSFWFSFLLSVFLSFFLSGFLSFFLSFFLFGFFLSFFLVFFNCDKYRLNPKIEQTKSISFALIHSVVLTLVLMQLIRSDVNTAVTLGCKRSNGSETAWERVASVGLHAISDTIWSRWECRANPFSAPLQGANQTHGLFWLPEKQFLTNKLLNWPQHGKTYVRGQIVSATEVWISEPRIEGGEKPPKCWLNRSAIFNIFISHVAPSQCWFPWCLFIFHISQLWTKHLWVFSPAPSPSHLCLCRYKRSETESNQIS